VALSACSTTDLEITPQLAGRIAPDDPALPDAVEVSPSYADGSALAALVPVVAESAAETALALAASAGDAPALDQAAEVAPVAVAFAGPTPDNPLAAFPAADPVSTGRKVAARSPELDALIARYAGHHGIPEQLLRRVVNRESTFNPAARNGPYWGLMQILPATARTMGYRGAPEGLLDAETNLIYAGKYLRGAWLVADGDHDLAVRFYARGYYYDAKRRGMLEATGLGKDRRRMRDS